MGQVKISQNFYWTDVAKLSDVIHGLHRLNRQLTLSLAPEFTRA